MPGSRHVPLNFSLFSCCLTQNGDKAHEVPAGHLSFSEHLPLKTLILTTSAPILMPHTATPELCVVFCVEPGKQKQLLLHRTCANSSDGCGSSLAEIKCCVLFQRMRVSSPFSRAWRKCPRSFMIHTKEKQAHLTGVKDPKLIILLSD